MLDDPRVTISPDNYGYLLEVIGCSIYDGVWVGEQSRIPHVAGIRKDLIDHLKQIAPSVIRWPGGCFADAYDWRDGIGPRAARPRRTSYWNDRLPKDAPMGPQRFDPNQFGTDEFIKLCRLTGGRPYLNANTRSLGPNEFDRWVEYCNSPKGSTTLADQRAEGGSPDPFNVRWWGIGNETWGLDGGATVEEYLALYKRFVAMVTRYGLDLALVAVGAPPGVSLEWVTRLVEGVNAALTAIPLHSISVHYYAGHPLNNWQPGDTIKRAAARGPVGSPPAIAPDEGAYLWMLSEYAGLDAYLRQHWDTLAAVDPRHEIKLAVDEWGAICGRGTELSPANAWSRAVTLRDVLGAAISLDALNRHADKVSVGCFTGLINQEGGLFVAEGDKFLATGIYHVFRMYAAHQGGDLVRSVIDAPTLGFSHDGRIGSVAGLSGSASLKGKTLTLTVVNPDLNSARETIIDLRDARVRSARLEAIASQDFKAQNTFEAPTTLVARPHPVTASGSSFTCMFPAGSASCLTLELE